MSFGSFLKGVVAQVLPGGGTYGTYNPSRKKKEEDAARAAAAAQAPQLRVTSNANSVQLPKPQRPANIFETLNKNLAVKPVQPTNTLQVKSSYDNTPIQQPKPGTIVKPQLKVTTAPAQELRVGSTIIRRDPNARTPASPEPKRPSNRISLGDIAKITARSAGAVGSNIVGGAAGMIKGVAQTPEAIANIPNYVRLGVAKLSNNKEAAENAAKSIANNEIANRFARFTRPFTDNLTEVEQATDRFGQRLAPWQTETQKNVVKALTNIVPTSGAVEGLSQLNRARTLSRAPSRVAPAALDEVDAGMAAVEKALAPRSIAVSGENAPQAINVRRVDQPRPIIREVTGDAELTTPRAELETRAAARNQRKLAKQYAKAQEETAAYQQSGAAVSPAAQSTEGFTPTGEFAKSANGGSYQKTNRATEMQQAVQETSQLSPTEVLQTARANQAGTGGFNRRDIRNIAALIETKRIPRGTPEWQEARQILKEDGTVWGQTGALRNYTMRRNASTDELVSRYESKIYRLADDPTKIQSSMFDQVEAAEDAFTTARDEAMAAYNRFTETPTPANTKAYHAAQDAADKADRAAREVEYSVAKQALKGNKDIKQARELEKMAQDADVYQMDAVDASMLSGTGTFVRNFVNSAIGGAEEGLFGGIGSRISKMVTGQKVGGGIGRGSAKGFGEGVSNIVSASKARAVNAGKNPLEHIKNWATTGNQLGDTVIDAQVSHNVLDHYTQVLKSQGYKGQELTDRASVMARQDPDNLSKLYSGAARASAGLGSGVAQRSKVEQQLTSLLSDALSNGNPNKYTEGASKLATRIILGYPTAIGRSAAEGGKRLLGGVPTLLKLPFEKDPQARALIIKDAVKQAGTGAVAIPTVFYALGASGNISGAYPTDPDERDRWEREGITENSIKIGGSWYQLPSYLGTTAIPAAFWATMGRNGGDIAASAADTAKIIPSLLPTDSMDKWSDVFNGRTDPGKFASQTGASIVRAATPGGALLNQLAKSFDSTKNDTNSGSVLENFVDKVFSGIPGVNNAANIPDKKDSDGNVLNNPNALELALGASSAVQGKGEERSQEIAAKLDKTVKTMADYGVFKDPNLKTVLDDKDLKIYNKAASGEKLDESDVKSLQKALVKGVSETGDDTAYLERGQYDTNLTALNLKRELMASDPSVKPSSLKKIDTAIKRGTIYKDNETPYELIDAYQSTGVSDWRSMGDSESDSYDPEMYQKLYNLDQLMSKAGVSYKKGSLSSPKYTQKKAGSGRGGRNMSTDFGQLKTTSSAPKVQSYGSIQTQAGGVPLIRTVRPNIVHKITTSG